MDELFKDVEKLGDNVDVDQFSSVLIKTGMSLLAMLFPVKALGD